MKTLALILTVLLATPAYAGTDSDSENEYFDEDEDITNCDASAEARTTGCTIVDKNGLLVAVSNYGNIDPYIHCSVTVEVELSCY